MSNVDSLMEERDLRVRLPAGRGESVPAVDGVSFNVHDGETIGVIGESGSGKSTLGCALVCLQKITIDSVRHAGLDLATLLQRELRRERRHFQLISQNDPNAALDLRMTILQSVREPLDVVGAGTCAEQMAQALRCLEPVGLHADHGARYPYGLSDGQRQRANIALALVMQSRLQVCDEVVAVSDDSIRPLAR